MPAAVADALELLPLAHHDDVVPAGANPLQELGRAAAAGAPPAAAPAAALHRLAGLQLMIAPSLQMAEKKKLIRVFSSSCFDPPWSGRSVTRSCRLERLRSRWNG